MLELALGLCATFAFGLLAGNLRRSYLEWRDFEADVAVVRGADGALKGTRLYSKAQARRYVNSNEGGLYVRRYRKRDWQPLPPALAIKFAMWRIKPEDALAARLIREAPDE